MKKLIVYAWLLLLSLIFLVGCGPNTQNDNLSKETNNSTVKANERQAKTFNGWTTVKFEGDVEFQIPPTLELRSEDTQKAVNKWAQKEMPDVYKFINTGDILKIIVQPKGFNDQEKDALEQFVRVIFRINKYSNTLPKWGEKIDFSQKDLDIIEKSSIDGAKQTTGIKNVYVISHAKIVSINDTSCVNIKYGTQLEDAQEYITDSYLFFNGDRTYLFLILIGSSEYEYWTTKDNDLRNIVQTFTLCK